MCCFWNAKITLGEKQAILSSVFFVMHWHDKPGMKVHSSKSVYCILALICLFLSDCPPPLFFSSFFSDCVKPFYELFTSVDPVACLLCVSVSIFVCVCEGLLFTWKSVLYCNGQWHSSAIFLALMIWLHVKNDEAYCVKF